MNRLISSVQILNKKMEFEIKRCGVPNMKRGKVISSEGVDLSTVKRLSVRKKKDITILEFSNIIDLRKLYGGKLSGRVF